MHTPNLLAATWRKSTYSAQNGSCVEVAFSDLVVGVRDSKNDTAGQLAVAAADWTSFVTTVKNDELRAG